MAAVNATSSLTMRSMALGTAEGAVAVAAFADLPILLTNCTKAILRFSLVLWSSVKSACGSTVSGLGRSLQDPALSNKALLGPWPVRRFGGDVIGPALPVS